MASHIKVALLGDSITVRNFGGQYAPYIRNTAIGIWNWVNWLVGSPFVFRNFGLSGDLIAGIAARSSNIPADIKVVFLLGGINDIAFGVASAVSIFSTLQSLVDNLAASGKYVLISTVLPHNSLTAPQLARLLELNGYIRTMRNAYVIDGFAFMGGSVITGACNANYMNTDNIHPTALGAQVFGLGAMTAGRLCALANTYNTSPFETYDVVDKTYSGFRTGTNGTLGQVTAPCTGVAPDGWQLYRVAGANVANMSLAPFVVNTTFLNQPSVGVSENTLTMTAATSALGDTYSALILGNFGDVGSLDGCVTAGSLFYCEADLEIVSGAVQSLSVFGKSYFTQGAAAVDQVSWHGAGLVSSEGGTTADSASAAQNLLPARYLVRGGVSRVPENLNGTVAIQTNYGVTAVLGAGGAVVRMSRPRLYVKNSEELT
jgi:lysophospholipase L1-like esterase